MAPRMIARRSLSAAFGAVAASALLLLLVWTPVVSAYSCGNPSSSHCYGTASWSQTAEYFGAFTQQNIGTYLTLTLDLQVIQSAIIQGAINGPAQMTGNFSQQQALALVSVLKYPPLPVVLHISSETPF